MTQVAEKTSNLTVAITEISNVVISSTHDTFKKMMDVQIQRKSIEVVDRNKSLFEVTSVISLTGELHGTICLSMPQDTVFALAHRVTGMEFTEVDEMVASCVSEFANVIAGSSKVALSSMNLDIGLPSIIRGDGCKIDFPSLAQPLCISYECELGPFILVFGFAK